MTQTIKSQSLKDKPIKIHKYGYLILFVFSMVLIGGFGYFFKRDAILHTESRRKDEKSLLAALEKKDGEIQDLKRIIRHLENGSVPSNFNEIKSISSLKKNVTDNFHKILLQQKLERRILNGKDFSLELHTLEILLNGEGKKTLESLRAYATEGIPTTFDIEEFIKNDIEQSKTLQQDKGSFKNILTQFFTISRVDHKENFSTLISFIRQDRMQRAIEFLDSAFPSKTHWRKMLERRLFVKRRLKRVEQAVIDSVKV